MLSDVFFRDLDIPSPDAHLGIGSGSHGVQTGAMLAALDSVLPQLAPDCVLVYGDTNSTLAATISSVKQHLPVAHLEAGLRSFNRRMPEEHNRVLTDHAADLLLAPTEIAMGHLAREGLSGLALLVGDVMTDVLLGVRDAVAGGRSALVDSLDLAPGGFYLATIHRAENTDDADRLRDVVASLAALDKPVVLLAHPRLVASAAAHSVSLDEGAILLHRPVSYPDLIAASLLSAGVITDSGGLQKEAFLLRVPCTTVRTETEWTETVELGWNVLATTPQDIRAAAGRPRPSDTAATPFGDGHAAERVIDALADRFS